MKKPRYFCEHCGAEVKRDAIICPHCGRFFSSVKCPKCNYSGIVDEFEFGCPVCGYAEKPTGNPEPFKPRPQTVTALPTWIYLAVGIVAVATIVVLLQALR